VKLNKEKELVEKQREKNISDGKHLNDFELDLQLKQKTIDTEYKKLKLGK